MKKLVIVYYRVYDIDRIELTIGGIQTYIHGLVLGLQTRYDVSLVQIGPTRTERIDNITILQFSKYKTIIKYLNRTLSPEDIIIWGTDNLASKLECKAKSVSIQHGIAFDYFPRENRTAHLLDKLRLQSVYRYFQQRNSLKWIDKADNIVCVDYNYLNWYRTKRLDSEKLTVIPNFAPAVNKRDRDNRGQLKVLFARRFVKKRGTEILVDLCRLCYENNLSIEFTFSGEGPEELSLKERLQSFKNISFTKFNPSGKADIFSSHDISIIPTIASEGTSFSLLESLSYGCVVLASNVGGMTNLIINEYNGFLCNPTAESFYEVLVKLDKNRPLLNRVKNRGYEVAEVLDANRWIKEWLKLLEKI
jgi:glycosyltransferase involved in cell wall biosynthesis